MWAKVAFAKYGRYFVEVYVLSFIYSTYIVVERFVQDKVIVDIFNESWAKPFFGWVKSTITYYGCTRSFIWVLEFTSSLIDKQYITLCFVKLILVILK